MSVGQPLPQQLPLPGFVQKIFRQTFYPSATDPEKATILEVTESSEIKDIDIVASAASTFKLTGRIIDGETGKPLPNVRLIIQQSNFSDYPLLQMNEMPEVEVYVVPDDRAPQGLGEMGVPPIVPAVVNAIFNASGLRIRKTPIQVGDLQV